MARDRGRESERQTFLDRLVAAIPFSPDAAIEVLDVGGGSGVVSDVVLAAFPNARVTLQDFSAAMLEGARARFGGRAGPTRYVRCDLREAGWPQSVGGPFDLAVSGIAIHNLHEMPAIGACYEAVRSLLKPGGCFLDYDHFDRVGGVALHQHMLKVAGFAGTEIVWHQHPTAVIKANT
jgi:SAM-dependent methyltransferase